MIDTHAHLNFSNLHSDLEGVLERARLTGVEAFVVPGCTLEDSQLGVGLAERYPGIYAAVGIHPTEVQSFGEGEQAAFRELLDAKKGIVSIGEVGLDYYHTENMNQILQKDVFAMMIGLAGEYDLPLIVHSREAFTDTFNLLEARKRGQKAVIHCFVGTAEEAGMWQEVDCMMSVTGIITYVKNEELRSVVQKIPLNRLMVETDSPFLPPQGHRGEVCEPMYVRNVVECLAEIKGLSVDEVDEITSANARNFFKI